MLLTALCREMEIVGELSALGISSRCTRALVLTTMFDVVAAVVHILYFVLSDVHQQL